MSADEGQSGHDSPAPLELEGAGRRACQGLSLGSRLFPRFPSMCTLTVVIPVDVIRLGARRFGKCGRAVAASATVVVVAVAAVVFSQGGGWADEHSRPVPASVGWQVLANPSRLQSPPSAVASRDKRK